MLTAFTGVSQLSLPIRIVDSNDDEPVSFGEPEAAAPIPAQQRHPGEHRWTVTRDLARDESTLDVVKNLGVVHLDDIDLSMSRRAHETYKFTADDFSSVRGETHWIIGFERGGWSTRTVTRTVLTCTLRTSTCTRSWMPTRASTESRRRPGPESSRAT
jgi:hypothetical protein